MLKKYNMFSKILKVLCKYFGFLQSLNEISVQMLSPRWP
jgi:hypothetical protein